MMVLQREPTLSSFTLDAEGISVYHTFGKRCGSAIAFSTGSNSAIPSIAKTAEPKYLK